MFLNRSGGSGNSSPAASSTGNAGDTPPRCGLSSPPPSGPGSTAGGAGTASESEDKATEEPASTTTPAPPPPPPPVELHPRKRKLRPKDSASSQSSGAAQSSPGGNGNSNTNSEQPEQQHYDSVSNSYQLFLNIRKQVMIQPRSKRTYSGRCWRLYLTKGRPWLKLLFVALLDREEEKRLVSRSAKATSRLQGLPDE